MSRIERRGILRGLAASALAAPLAQMFAMHNSRAATGALPTMPPSTNTAPMKCRSVGPSGSGTRYSTLPSISDVPPSGLGENLSSPTAGNVPFFGTESRAVFGSQNLIASEDASHGLPFTSSALIR